MKIQGIYAIANLVNGDRYFGSSLDCEKRFRIHVGNLTRGLHVNPKLLAAWRKYGASAFVLEIVEIVAERNSLLEREDAFIPLGKYNLAPKAGRPPGMTRKFTEEEKHRFSIARAGVPKSGLRGRKLSAEQRAKMSKSLTGIVFSPERCANISVALKGSHSERRSASMIGNKRGQVPCSEEKRAKLTATLNSPEVKAKLSAAHLGRPQSVEHIAKRVAKQTGQQRSLEQRARMRTARLRFLALREMVAV